MQKSKKSELKNSGMDVMDKFFTASSSDNDNTVKKSNNQKKKSFSFRADSYEADCWRAYAFAKGIKMDDFGAIVFNDYIKAHNLSDLEQVIYDAKLSQTKS